jgi:uncharacterized protein
MGRRDRGAIGGLFESQTGTVDKFRGQEAPIVMYPCTASSPQEAPRGKAFPYDPHRFKVAPGRARGAVIVGWSSKSRSVPSADRESRVTR